MKPELLAMLNETERDDYHETATHPHCKWGAEAVAAIYRSLAEARQELDKTRQRWNTEAEHIQALYLETLRECDTAIADLRQVEAQVAQLRSGLEHVKLYPCPVCNLNKQPRPKGLCPYQDALAASEEEK